MEPRPVRPAPRETAPIPAPSRPTPAGFQALLEELEHRARDLETAAADVADPKGLGRAVARAHLALDGALELGASLIEAYRQELTQRDPRSSP